MTKLKEYVLTHTNIGDFYGLPLEKNFLAGERKPVKKVAVVHRPIEGTLQSGSKKHGGHHSSQGVGHRWHWK
jgi:hypothetical protein